MNTTRSAPPPAEAALLRSTDTEDRVIARLDAIEGRLAQLAAAVEAAPAAAAAVVDAADDVAARLRERGVDPEVRLQRLLHLTERLTDDATIERLEAALDLVVQAPALAALLTDVVDEQARRLADEGIDVGASLANGARAALRFGVFIGPREIDALQTLLTSEALAPGAVAVVSDAASALHAAHEAPPRPVGLLGLARALRDPDVQHAAGFLLSFARHLGRTLPH